MGGIKTCILFLKLKLKLSHFLNCEDSGLLLTIINNFFSSINDLKVKQPIRFTLLSVTTPKFVLPEPPKPPVTFWPLPVLVTYRIFSYSNSDCKIYATYSLVLTSSKTYALLKSFATLCITEGYNIGAIELSLNLPTSLYGTSAISIITNAE